MASTSRFLPTSAHLQSHLPPLSRCCFQDTAAMSEDLAVYNLYPQIGSAILHICLCLPSASHSLQYTPMSAPTDSRTPWRLGLMQDIKAFMARPPAVAGGTMRSPRTSTHVGPSARRQGLRGPWIRGAAIRGAAIRSQLIVLQIQVRGAVYQILHLTRDRKNTKQPPSQARNETTKVITH